MVGSGGWGCLLPSGAGRLGLVCRREPIGGAAFSPVLARQRTSSYRFFPPSTPPRFSSPAFPCYLFFPRCSVVSRPPFSQGWQSTTRFFSFLGSVLLVAIFVIIIIMGIDPTSHLAQFLKRITVKKRKVFGKMSSKYRPLAGPPFLLHGWHDNKVYSSRLPYI